MKKAQLAFLIAGTLLSHGAAAYFGMDRETIVAGDYYSHAQKQIAFGVVQRGTGPLGDPVSGSGNDIPMDMTFRLLAPIDWDLVVVEEGLAKQPLTWTEGDNWVDTFNAIGKQHEVNFLVDWNTKRLVASRISLTPEQQAKLLNKTPVATPQAAEKPQKMARATPVPSDRQVTEANAATPLSSNMPRTAKQEVSRKAKERSTTDSSTTLASSSTSKMVQAVQTNPITDHKPALEAHAKLAKPISLKEFVEGFVSKDVPNLTLKEAVQILLPDGWKVRMSENAIEQFKSYRFDVLAQGPRGAALHKLLRPVGLNGTPYTFHRTFVVEGYQ